MRVALPTFARPLLETLAFGSAHPEFGPRLKLLESHEGWWEHKNVLGLCWARKSRAHRLGDVALQVLVEKKLNEERLRPQHVVPPQIEFRQGKQRHSVATDVRQVGKARLETLVSGARPAHPGFNIGHELEGSGTLCCAVTDRQSHQLLGLSCGHVIGRFGRGRPGERVTIPSKTEAAAAAIPAHLADFGALVRVGKIRSSFEQAPFNIDGATFAPNRPAELDAAIALLGRRPTKIRDEVPIGLPVYKVGYMTGLTAGLVQAVHLTVSFPFPFKGGARAVWFTEQIGISRLAAEGDSGALVVDQGGTAIGIHIGSFGDMSICTPIRRVLDALGCDLA